jgi:hypothetical protein
LGVFGAGCPGFGFQNLGLGFLFLKLRAAPGVFHFTLHANSSVTQESRQQLHGMEYLAIQPQLKLFGTGSSAGQQSARGARPLRRAYLVE